MRSVYVWMAARWRMQGVAAGTERTLLISCVFSFVLLMSRIIFTRSLMFIFLPWNLFLAFIPYRITRQLCIYGGFPESRAKRIFLFLCWLAFVPNTFYILTDLFHFKEAELAPPWFNLALLFSFAWNGLLMGIVSIQQMERLTRPWIALRWRGIFVSCIVGLSAVGIYIGRYLRFNSWDLVMNPFQLFGDLYYLFRHPLRSSHDWGMILVWAILIVISYESVVGIGYRAPIKKEG